MAQKLEEALEQAVDDQLEEGVSGICVSDTKGFPIITKGSLKPEVAPLSAQLLSLAAQLDPEAAAETSPVVTICGEHNKVTFSKEKNTIVTVHTTY